MRPRISIRGVFRPLVHLLVRPSVGMSRFLHEIESFMYRNDPEGIQSHE